MTPLARLRLPGWSVTLAVAALLASTGCQEDVPYAVLIDLRTRMVVTTLRIQVKQYHLDGTTTLYEEHVERIPAETSGYVVSEHGEPLRLNIRLPDRGRYAIHIVGTPPTGDPPTSVVLVTTTCHEVTGVLHLPDVQIGRLPPELDEDGDTFPESQSAFCALQEAESIECDVTCDTPEYEAMLDCNPPADYVYGPHCGELPPDPEWNPFTNDLCGDCHDQDCWSEDATCQDEDGDGFPGGVDCDDDDPDVNPDAAEVCGNGRDDNCLVEDAFCLDGDVPCDEDGDGSPAIHPDYPGCGSDCDDGNPAIRPTAYEGCGSNPADPAACPGCRPPAAGVDDDCDGRIDEGCFADDLDDDGIEDVAMGGADCDDCNSAIGPGFEETCSDGIDQDCSGDDAACAGDDGDGDGFARPPAGDDCDDNDEHVYPGAPDRCGDGIAQNCVLDVDCAEIADADGDGFGAGVGDCDDANALINPWGTETCDPAGLDEDCDGRVNEVESVGGAPPLEGCILDAEAGTWSPVRYADDIEHCGECRHICCANPFDCEGDVCDDGVCRCTNGEDDPHCAGTLSEACCVGVGCVNLQVDLANCGACGHACLPRETCSPDSGDDPGRCRCNGGDGCPQSAGSACCPDGCVDLNVNLDNCGECGNQCTTGARRGDQCVAGACVCGPAQEICSGNAWCTELTEPAGETCGCRDLNNDRANCGACGHACLPRETCSADESDDRGRCRCNGGDACPQTDGSACCDDGCVNLNEDVNNCGECGHACAWGEECVSGSCRCNSDTGEACDADEDCCDGSCRQVLEDNQNCGPLGTGLGCGNRCAGDGPCNDGVCNCSPGYSDCEDECDCHTGGGQLCCSDVCVDAECCDDSDCPGSHNRCVSGRCRCDEGYIDCGGTCNCHTGGDYVCCGESSCERGECCNDRDCGDLYGESRPTCGRIGRNDCGCLWWGGGAHWDQCDADQVCCDDGCKSDC